LILKNARHSGGPPSGFAAKANIISTEKRHACTALDISNIRPGGSAAALDISNIRTLKVKTAIFLFCVVIILVFCVVVLLIELLYFVSYLILM
jgi:hypothetical protein